MSCPAHQDLDPEGFYSDAIEDCLWILDEWGWEAHLHASVLADPFGNLPTLVAARTYYEEKAVVMSVACGGCAFIALAHEVGHVLAYRVAGKAYLALDRGQREQWAYLLGWGVVCHLGMWELVPLAMWEEHHGKRDGVPRLEG